ncbi:unnamed protein product [Rotaria magnacalcarata]
MATHSYVIRDLDDDDDNDDNSNQRESLNLFSKRMKIDDLSKNNDTHSYESNPSNPIPETDSSTSSIRPSPSIPSSSSLLVHSRQRGNPLLKHIRQLPYQLKLLLVQCDVNDPSQSLKELARLSIIYELTLLISWNDEESAKYLETYKIMEGKSAESLMDLQQYQSNDFLTKYIDMITELMEKHPATVCYFGLVDNHSGEWIGIEWWNQQGKHNGTFNGKFYFKTKNPLNGSFIRRQRISFENSFAQAIQKQYIKSFSNKNITPDISYSARYFIAWFKCTLGFS